MSELKGKVILFSQRKWNNRLRKVTLQLISSVNADPSNEMRGKMGKECKLEKEDVREGEIVFNVTFEWDGKIGKPGAILVRNNHYSAKFFLKSLTLEEVPGSGTIHFDCNSWIHPKRYTTNDSIFFANKAYLPHETPKPLQKYREDELMKLRGNGNGERKKGEKIYDYDVYNDMCDLESNRKNMRPILGGSHRYPYPRRGRTGRPRSNIDDRYETTCSIREIYVPSDERFGHLKKSDFDAHKCKSGLQIIKDRLKVSFGKFPRQFDSLRDVFALYEPRSFVRRAKFPLPLVIKDSSTKWRTDEEFAREMLAGVNPMIIRRLQEFPPSSKLDPSVYGDQTSKITNEHIMHSLDGLTVDEAIGQNKLYILDYHDIIIPYLREINTKTSTRTYATRTLLFLNYNGTLKPLAIELSLPHPQGDQFGIFSRIMLPNTTGIGESLWQLAKAYVIVNDAGHHQLVSHWLNTHVVIEPFVIATNRQLSVLHPIHKLLIPHFRYTMKINSLARGTLINADGIIEKTQYPSKYSMEMSSMAYRSWNFTQQALPADLIKRGVAIVDSSAPHGLRLLINDYPYAVDGLDIWTTIKTWVVDYCSFYYKDDEMICNDKELRSWWKELRERGHEDKKDEPWWPKMQNLEELIHSCTIIIWISSALHAAVNFGQYAYGGFLPNRPSTSRGFLPEEGTNDYQELRSNPDKVFLKIFTSELQNDLLNISTIELLSTHSLDEFYLGQRSNPEWTFDKEVLDAFEKFKERLLAIEDMIVRRNKDLKLKNRVGPVNMPYTLLQPSSNEGLTTRRGIPNSISI